MNLDYQEFQLPTYLNTSAAVTIPCLKDDRPAIVQLTIPDILLASFFAGLNTLLISDTGRGKTQLVKDVANTYFGGFGTEGHANFKKARPNMTSIMDMFEIIDVDTSSGKYNSDQSRLLNMDRVSRLFHAVDELNLAPQVLQAEFFDLAEGEYAFKGIPIRLGRNDYSVCMATMNMNKNGDNGFSGTFDVNRALLNRTHLTLDLDTPKFRPTLEDRDALARRVYLTVKTKNAEPRDLTEKILFAYERVQEITAQESLSVRIFRQLLDDAFSYCDTDEWKDKEGIFPMKCSECTTYSGKICSLTKGCSERTLQAITGLSAAFHILAEMKYGSNIKLKWFDLMLAAFSLTSYHGNLNSIVLSEKYAGRRQLMMDHVISQLKNVCAKMDHHFFNGVLVPKIITNPEITLEYSPEIEGQLRSGRVNFSVMDLEETLRAEGLGTGWIRLFTRPQEF